jgi:hypothetical protein
MDMRLIQRVESSLPVRVWCGRLARAAKQYVQQDKILLDKTLGDLSLLTKQGGFVQCDKTLGDSSLATKRYGLCLMRQSAARSTN